jgi:hypothetical protein
VRLLCGHNLSLIYPPGGACNKVKMETGTSGGEASGAVAAVAVVEVDTQLALGATKASTDGVTRAEPKTVSIVENHRGGGGLDESTSIPDHGLPHISWEMLRKMSSPASSSRDVNTMLRQGIQLSATSESGQVNFRICGRIVTHLISSVSESAHDASFVCSVMSGLFAVIPFRRMRDDVVVPIQFIQWLFRHIPSTDDAIMSDILAIFCEIMEAATMTPSVLEDFGDLLLVRLLNMNEEPRASDEDDASVWKNCARYVSQLSSQLMNLEQAHLESTITLSSTVLMHWKCFEDQMSPQTASVAETVIRIADILSPMRPSESPHLENTHVDSIHRSLIDITCNSKCLLNKYALAFEASSRLKTYIHRTNGMKDQFDSIERITNTLYHAIGSIQFDSVVAINRIELLVSMLGCLHQCPCDTADLSETFCCLRDLNIKSREILIAWGSRTKSFLKEARDALRDLNSASIDTVESAVTASPTWLLIKSHREDYFNLCTVYLRSPILLALGCTELQKVCAGVEAASETGSNCSRAVFIGFASRILDSLTEAVLMSKNYSQKSALGVLSAVSRLFHVEVVQELTTAGSTSSFVGAPSSPCLHCGLLTALLKGFDHPPKQGKEDCVFDWYHSLTVTLGEMISCPKTLLCQACVTACLSATVSLLIPCYNVRYVGADQRHKAQARVLSTSLKGKYGYQSGDDLTLFLQWSLQILVDTTKRVLNCGCIIQDDKQQSQIQTLMRSITHGMRRKLAFEDEGSLFELEVESILQLVMVIHGEVDSTTELVKDIQLCVLAVVDVWQLNLENIVGGSAAGRVSLPWILDICKKALSRMLAIRNLAERQVRLDEIFSRVSSINTLEAELKRDILMTMCG